MFSRPKLLLLATSFITGCVAYIESTSFLSPKEYLQPWQKNINQQCSKSSLHEAQAALTKVYYDLDNLSLDQLLTTDEMKDLDLLQSFVKPLIYQRYPKRIQAQPTAILYAKAQKELESLCDEHKKNRTNISQSNTFRYSFSLSSKGSNAWFDAEKYPNILAFFNSVNGEREVYFHTSDELDAEPNFHIDGNHVVSINTHKALATRIITDAHFNSVHLDKFEFKKRMWQALCNGKLQDTEIYKKFKSIALETNTENIKRIERGINVMIAELEDQLQKSIDERSVYNDNQDIFKNHLNNQITFLPSGGVYNLDFAVHSAPPKLPENEKGCRMFLQYKSYS